jgi:hypothetical protein
LPGGNRFFLSRPSSSRDGDLSSSSESTTTTPMHRRINREQDILSDALWQHVLSYCTATALAQVIQSSRYFYVTGHQPELWQDLVLRYCHTHGNLVLDEHVVIGGGTCWKDTYILLLLQQQQQQQTTEDDANSNDADDDDDDDDDNDDSCACPTCSHGHARN